MREFATRFLEKEVIIYTLHSQQIEGTLKEVTDGAVLLLRKGGDYEAVNLDYVVRLREYPMGKNGKRKSIVLD